MAQSSTVAVAIASGASLSGSLAVEGKDVVAVMMPAAWDAANLTFQGSHDNVTFQNVYDDAGTELVVTAAAARYITLGTAIKLLRGVRFLKVRSGTAGTPVNVTANRAFFLITGERF